MRINSIQYHDKKQEWKCLPIHFFNMTLLVGISGVGKTQILKSLISLKDIAKGKSQDGVAWEISFSNEGAEYLWEGEFELLDKNSFFENIISDNEEDNKPKLIKEVIKLSGKEIAKRDEKEIFFENKKMPKLAPEESLISIFKEEENIKKAFEGFKKIIFRDHTQKEEITFRMLDFSKIKEKHKTLEDIRESDLDTIVKLYCLFENQKETFDLIKEGFIDVFPQIKDVKIEPIKDDNVPSIFSESPIIHIEEKGVNKWIPQNRISSGMLRTFLHISEMYLLNEGTVILIDEFENSLGVNCINALTEDLIFSNNNIQFIATSHHPYIINKIPYEYWKIVTREKGEIITYDAKDFNLGESHHERFMSLINLPKYKQGIVNV